MKKISLIIPVYNEENLIEKTVKELDLFIKKQKEPWEIIFVDDGSTDNSLAILKNFKPKFFKIISYSKNQGKGFALKKGVFHASGDYIGFTDSDLAYSFENLKKVIKPLIDFDISIGSRSLSSDNHEKINQLRRVLGKGFNILTRILLGFKFKDTQCGLKAFKSKVAKDLFSKQTIKGFSFDTEILYLAKKKKYTLKETEAIVLKSHLNKKSKVNLLLDPLKMFLDLLKIRINDLIGKYE